MAQTPTLSDLKFYTASVDWGSDYPIVVSGSSWAEAVTVKEEAMVSKDMEILLDLLEQRTIPCDEIQELREIMAYEEWQTAFLVWMLINEVGNGLSAKLLGLAEDDD